MLIIGLMSGTSADGVDAALVELNGAPPVLSWKLLQHVHQPYPPGVKGEILACTRPAESSAARLCRINFVLAQYFAQAALSVIQSAGITPADIDLIGSHGQTLWHDPLGTPPSTLQLGEAAVIAEITGITTIHNFRVRDVAAGGQGAPLTGYTDVLLFTHPTLTRACQNIGGIANLTFLPAANSVSLQPFAFDCGPGNMLLDDAMRRISHSTLFYDRDGALAALGTVDKELLASWLKDEPYFHLPPPKTTGREYFNATYGERLWQQAQQRALSDADFIATLTALTAHSIALAYRTFLPLFPEEVIVSGGGSANKTLMHMLGELLQPARLYTSDEFGLPSPAKEAVAFAVLAYETWHNRPANLPSATGARKAVILGSITPGRNFKGGAS